MRVHDLFEMPIRHLGVHDMDQPGTFPDVDRRLMRSPAHIEKIRKKFADTEHTYNLYFLNQPGKSYMQTLDPDEIGDEEFIENSPQTIFNSDFSDHIEQYSGLATPETIAQFTKMAIPPDPGAITVLFISNANEERTVSLTPWMIAHRFAHALTDKSSPLLGNLIYAIPNENATVATTAKRQAPSAIAVKLMQTLTMRSARTNNLSSGEVKEELIAQYILQGRVILKLPANLARPNAYPDLEAQLIQVANKLNTTIADILDVCVGKIFISI